VSSDNDNIPKPLICGAHDRYNLHLYRLATPLLFRIEPERAHALGMSLMRLVPAVNIDDPSLQVKTKFGVLRNPIGLAAGYDKTASHLSSIERLGFGYLIAGTVTNDPWPGHLKPRIVRYPSDKTMVNALGFPNPGVDRYPLLEGELTAVSYAR